MRFSAGCFVAVFTAFVLHAESHVCGGHGDKDTLLVSTASLNEHLRDPNLVILAIGQKSEYDEAHIPGARFLEYNDTHTTHEPGSKELTLELPPMAQLVEVFEKVGVSNNSHIVLYETSDWAAPTARVFLTLDAMGLGSRTSILDGGLPVWRNEKRPVTSSVPAFAKGSLKPCPQADVIASLSDVRSSLHRPGVDIVDARLTDFYTGAKIPSGQRAGHIPGASNLTYTSMTDDAGRLKSREAIAEMFHKAGIKPGDRVISYCHIGQQASLIYFVARYLGYDARMYDGSWQEWSAHTELPAEVSPNHTN